MQGDGRDTQIIGICQQAVYTSEVLEGRVILYSMGWTGCGDQ